MKLEVLIAASLLATLAATNARTETQSEVTVTARRIELEQRVSKFVNEIASLEHEESIPRWHEPVCPSVTGLPRPEAEFFLGRISEIARAASVPLAGEHCRPNLYVLVTIHPTELLEAMEQRNFAFIFGPDALPSTVDEFIRTPRPVRVWYTSGIKTPEGAHVPPGLPPYAQISNGPVVSPLHVDHENDRHSRLVFTHIWTFSFVYVVVDQTRLRGLSRMQFADYVAMVDFADIKPDAHLGNAPTILKLFDLTPATAPTGMSAWDETFLKSLYATKQVSKQQRGQIARSIMRGVAP